MHPAPKIAKPCQAKWSHMHGDDRVRLCTHCDRKVYNLSAMSRADAEALLRDGEGRICIRLYQRADGTAMTKDCGLAEKAAVKTKAIVVGLLTALGALIFPMASSPRSTRSEAIIGRVVSPRTTMEMHLKRVREYTVQIKATKDPEGRRSLEKKRKEEADLAQAAARLVEREGPRREQS
ncbi:MAG: hypothetical protein ACO1SV_23680 [Fimbriimonas sp.]